MIDSVERTMKHAIEEEEGVPLSSVTNFDEVSRRSCKFYEDFTMNEHRIS